MIRINLLPTRDAPRRQAAAVQLVVFGVLIVVVAAVLLVIDFYQKDQLASQERANAVIQNRVEGIRRQIQDHEQIRSRIEEIEGKQVVIDQLIAGRTGPTMMMVELARVLSRNGSPTIDHDRYMDLVRRSPGQAYDPNWDGRRLWLQSFDEQRRQVELRGSAMSHEDVAELLRRMTLSDYFHEVTLINTRSSDASRASSTAGPGLVSFEIRCRLRYGGLPASAPAGDGSPSADDAAGTGA